LRDEGKHDTPTVRKALTGTAAGTSMDKHNWNAGFISTFLESEDFDAKFTLALIQCAWGKNAGALPQYAISYLIIDCMVTITGRHKPSVIRLNRSVQFTPL
jgi:hypothetical protein